MVLDAAEIQARFNGLPRVGGDGSLETSLDKIGYRFAPRRRGWFLCS